MTDTTHKSGAPWRNFYGRFKGHTLRGSQQVYLKEDLESLSPGAVGWEETPSVKILTSRACSEIGLCGSKLVLAVESI